MSRYPGYNLPRMRSPRVLAAAAILCLLLTACGPGGAGSSSVPAGAASTPGPEIGPSLSVSPAFDERATPAPGVTGRGSLPPGVGEQPPPGSPVSAPTPSHSPSSSLGGRVGDAGGPGAARNLQARPRCEATGSRVGVADLSWAVADQRGSQQRVALTKFRDGFSTGNFEVSPSLTPGGSSFTWRGINPGGVHFWRVLTMHGDVWAPSGTETVTGPTCVADFIGPGPGT